MKKVTVGEKYNRFTIVEDLSSKRSGNNSYKMVRAVCECGNERSLEYKELRKGKRKSCGCLVKEKVVNIEKENTYNYWTILGEADPYQDNSGNKFRKVLAQCICGKEKELLLHSLRTGNSRSCGCKVEITRTPKKDIPIRPLDLDKSNQRDLGAWTVVEEISAKRNKKGDVVRTVKCKCKCGFEKITKYNNVKDSKSCFNCSMKNRKICDPTEEQKNKKLIMTKYHSMLTRCNNKMCRDYKNYGARGITVCEEWQNSSDSFYKWCLNNGFDKRLELDREDNDKGYSPDNCRFISHANNSRNSRQSKLNWDIVNIVKERYRDGCTIAKLALELKVSRSCVSGVVNGKTWVE